MGVLRVKMEVTIRTNGLAISGRTYQYRDFLKSKGFKWEPNQKVWTHPDIDMRRAFSKYHKVTDLRRFQYIKKTYEDRKVATLQVCESLPTDITKEIFKKIWFPKCRCSDKWVCSDCTYACCEKATPTFCVCTHATNCPTHGRRCNGSHD